MEVSLNNLSFQPSDKIDIVKDKKLVAALAQEVRQQRIQDTFSKAMATHAEYGFDITKQSLLARKLSVLDMVNGARAYVNIADILAFVVNMEELMAFVTTKEARYYMPVNRSDESKSVSKKAIVQWLNLVVAAEDTWITASMEDIQAGMILKN